MYENVSFFFTAKKIDCQPKCDGRDGNGFYMFSTYKYSRLPTESTLCQNIESKRDGKKIEFTSLNGAVHVMYPFIEFYLMSMT